MDILIILGALVSLIGLGAIVYCIVSAMRIRKAKLDDEQMRARLQGLVAWNLGGLFTSVIGLLLVVVGIFLG